jgi:hypothetical protein
MAVIIRFAWAPILMGFVLLGVTEPSTMLAVVIGCIILGAPSLHAKLNRRPV